jgi:hypothetical protein
MNTKSGTAVTQLTTLLVQGPRLSPAQLYNPPACKHGPLCKWLRTPLDLDIREGGEVVQQEDSGQEVAHSSETEVGANSHYIRHDETSPVLKQQQD